MGKAEVISSILADKTSLGIELGSTRIKAVLIGPDHEPIAMGSHDWENQLTGGIWTYSIDAIWAGLQDCYAHLRQDVREKYGVELTGVGSMGISAMMHGYMVFDKNGDLLVPFRTWRNTTTARSSEELIPLFDYPIPHRWNIAHLYQAILNEEQHVSQVAYLTTLAGYIHWQLTGEKLIGVGDASGMFPIDLSTGQFDTGMIAKFDNLIKDKRFPWTLAEILPGVLPAGEQAGRLTEKGAKLLDPSGALKPGIAFCPAEGDAQTGMVATNSVAQRTGNVSAGTSIFLMAVLEKELKRVHPEIDLVTTPVGDLVAMVHCNNCTGDINAWVKVFEEVAGAFGLNVSKSELYMTLYSKALEADSDCGGLLSYNYISGESITDMPEGRPLFLRMPDSDFTLANFMRMNLYSALGTLKIGYDILEKEEGVKLDELYGHGGFFKTERVGQRMMAAAIETPVTVMTTAGEGGPWGMALLAAYMKNRRPKEPLQEYLNKNVFAHSMGVRVVPAPGDIEGFKIFMRRYKNGLEVERAAVNNIK